MKKERNVGERTNDEPKCSRKVLTKKVPWTRGRHRAFNKHRLNSYMERNKNRLSRIGSLPENMLVILAPLALEDMIFRRFPLRIISNVVKAVGRYYFGTTFLLFLYMCACTDMYKNDY